MLYKFEKKIATRF